MSHLSDRQIAEYVLEAAEYRGEENPPHENFVILAINQTRVNPLGTFERHPSGNPKLHDLYEIAVALRDESTQHY